MRKTTSEKKLKSIANKLRQDCIKALANAGSGHTAGPLGMADIFACLYFNILRHDPNNPSWQKRDRLILSNGHICIVQYAAMARAGYFNYEELFTYRKINSRLQGHPSRVDLPGIEVSTASLGQGVSVTVGMALAAKLNGDRHTVYCITSDGEQDEGSTWEAINFAGKQGLDNVIFIMDRNHIQISGKTEDVLPLEPLKDKYRSFGWAVLEMKRPTVKQILSTLKQAKKKKKPVVVIAQTTPGKGVSFIENKYEWHGKAPNQIEALKALKELEEEAEKI